MLQVLINISLEVPAEEMEIALRKHWNGERSMYSKNLPKKTRMLPVFTVGGILLCAGTTPANAEGLEWVAPGTYDFGTCGDLGGDSVPGLRRKYYSQSTCLNEYDADRCDTQVRFYQRQFIERGETSCSGWMRSEQANCRSTVNSLAQQCYRLAN